MKKPKRLLYPNSMTKLITDPDTYQQIETAPVEKWNPAAMVLGRLGGLMGGKASDGSHSKKAVRDCSSRSINAMDELGALSIYP